VSFAAITLCVASQLVFIVIVVYFVIDSVRKLLDTPPYFVTDSVWELTNKRDLSVGLWTCRRPKNI
jgi:ABC-type phosphate transport system permease subunit